MISCNILPRPAGYLFFCQSYYRIAIFLARAIVNYNDRFLVTGTIRADGSTRFGENNKYGYFPSVGVAWNISREDFLANNNLVSNLKLRLGWGQTGNQEFPSGASLNRIWAWTAIYFPDKLW
jgi:iron complex outermembrane receptor protein